METKFMRFFHPRAGFVLAGQAGWFGWPALAVTGYMR